MKKLVLLKKKNYLTAIRNSVGTSLFKNLYANVGGRKKDIVHKGTLSCALFVSSILYLFDLIKHVHATVDGTILDLQKSGWEKTVKPRAGDVILWQEKIENGEPHEHIGFFIGNNMAVSNNSKTGTPTRHVWNRRTVVSVFRKIDL